MRNRERNQPAKAQKQKRLEDRVWHRRQLAKGHELRIEGQQHEQQGREAIIAALNTILHGGVAAMCAGDDWRIRHYGYTRIYEQSEQLDRRPQISAHALRDATQQPAD
jgi:hypothetical protein